MTNVWACYILGYFFAVVVAQYPISLIVDKLWRGIGWTDDQVDDIRPYSRTPKILGYIERSLYVGSFQLGKPEFIGIWLALKVAGQWNRWSEDKKYGEHFVPGRHTYNIFLIGNGLSIAYAITGAKLIEWCSNDLSLAIVVPISLLLATLILSRLV